MDSGDKRHRGDDTPLRRGTGGGADDVFHVASYMVTQRSSNGLGWVHQIGSATCRCRRGRKTPDVSPHPSYQNTVASGDTPSQGQLQFGAGRGRGARPSDGRCDAHIVELWIFVNVVLFRENDAAPVL